MGDALTLPGTIPGLLRRCSPVVLVDAARWWDADAKVGIVTSVEPFEVACGTAWEPADRRQVFDLDLTDATGRVHAVSWLAEQRTETTPTVALFGYSMKVGWVLNLGEDSSIAGMWDDVLANLDPHDPRLLPDGSRWVEAEAIRLACLHAAAWG